MQNKDNILRGSKCNNSIKTLNVNLHVLSRFFTLIHSRFFTNNPIDLNKQYDPISNLLANIIINDCYCHEYNAAKTQRNIIILLTHLFAMNPFSTP